MQFGVPEGGIWGNIFYTYTLIGAYGMVKYNLKKNLVDRTIDKFILN